LPRSILVLMRWGRPTARGACVVMNFENRRRCAKDMERDNGTAPLFVWSTVLQAGRAGAGCLGYPVADRRGYARLSASGSPRPSLWRLSRQPKPSPDRPDLRVLPDGPVQRQGPHVSVLCHQTRRRRSQRLCGNQNSAFRHRADVRPSEGPDPSVFVARAAELMTACPACSPSGQQYAGARTRRPCGRVCAEGAKSGKYWRHSIDCADLLTEETTPGSAASCAAVVSAFKAHLDIWARGFHRRPAFRMKKLSRLPARKSTSRDREARTGEGFLFALVRTRCYCAGGLRQLRSDAQMPATCRTDTALTRITDLGLCGTPKHRWGRS